MREEQVLISAQYLQRQNIKPSKIAVILGSGLGDFADSLTDIKTIPYSDIPEFPRSTVEGHLGQFVSGQVGGVPILVLQGRFHFYEGKSLQDVTYPVRVLKKLGVQTIIVSNAAGSLNKNFEPGSMMLIKDHLNLIGDNPLRGKNWEGWGPRFPNMSQAYNPKLRELALQTANALNISLHQGVYAAISGPSYETPAEVRMLQILGADAVGMSTVPEVIVAYHQGMKIVGLSCLANYAPSVGHYEVNHEDVLKVMNLISETFSRFLQEFIIQISRESF